MFADYEDPQVEEISVTILQLYILKEVDVATLQLYKQRKIYCSHNNLEINVRQSLLCNARYIGLND